MQSRDRQIFVFFPKTTHQKPKRQIPADFNRSGKFARIPEERMRAPTTRFARTGIFDLAAESDFPAPLAELQNAVWRHCHMCRIWRLQARQRISGAIRGVSCLSGSILASEGKSGNLEFWASGSEIFPGRNHRILEFCKAALIKFRMS